MNLGKHYVALNVKDIEASLRFYEQMGFTADPNCGGVAQKWLMLTHGELTIGLYQDMFPSNILTFNPSDARAVQKHMKARGLHPEKPVDEDGEGPCYFMLQDPDGNQILIDQH